MFVQVYKRSQHNFSLLLVPPPCAAAALSTTQTVLMWCIFGIWLIFYLDMTRVWYTRHIWPLVQYFILYLFHILSNSLAASASNCLLMNALFVLPLILECSFSAHLLAGREDTEWNNHIAHRLDQVLMIAKRNPYNPWIIGIESGNIASRCCMKRR